MLFTESQLAVSYSPLAEATSILKEAVYLDEAEAALSPIAVPVVENSRLGAPIVSFADVERLAEENGIEYADAQQAIAEANGISDIAVAVPEWQILMDPSLVNEMSNIVIAPLSANDIVGKFTEACLDAFVESGNYACIDTLLSISESILSQDPIKDIEEKYTNMINRYKKLQAGYPENSSEYRKYQEKIDSATSTQNKELAAARMKARSAAVNKKMADKNESSEEDLQEKLEKMESNRKEDTNQEKNAESFLEKVKQTCYHKPKTFIYKQIAKIREWAAKMEKSTETGIWAKIKQIVAKVINTLTSWANQDKLNKAAAGETI